MKSLWCLLVGRPACLFLALALLWTSTGCSSKGSVTGKVTFQGKPLPGGHVTFVPPKEGSERGGGGQINPQDGSYRIEGMSTGTMKVIVQPYRAPLMPIMPGGMKNLAPQMKDPSQSAPEGSVEVDIPEKYGDPETTPLSVTVKGGEQVFDINVD